MSEIIDFLKNAGSIVFVFGAVALVFLGASYFDQKKEQIKSDAGDSIFWTLDSFIKKAVEAAEQVAESKGLIKAGEMKYDWVVGWVIEFARINGITLNEVILRPLIEAAVAALGKKIKLDVEEVKWEQNITPFKTAELVVPEPKG